MRLHVHGKGKFVFEISLKAGAEIQSLALFTYFDPNYTKYKLKHHETWKKWWNMLDGFTYLSL